MTNVWVSKFYNDSRKAVCLDSDMTKAGKKDEMRAYLNHQNGRTDILPESSVPRRLYCQDRRQDTRTRFPSIFWTGHTYVLDAAAFEVVSQFNLGGNMLYPIEIWTFDGSRPIERQGFYALLVNEIKTALLPEMSKGLKIMNPDGSKWMLYVETGTELVVSGKALEGADIWRDSSMFREIFISDALFLAFTKAKMHTRFDAFRCAVKVNQ